MAEKRSRRPSAIKNLKEEIEILHTIIRTVWSELDLDTVLKSIVSVVQKYTDADSVLLYLYDKEKRKLSLAASADSSETPKSEVILNLGEGITGWVAANRTTVVVDEKSYEDPRFKFIPGLLEDTYEAFLSVPLIHRNELIGVLNVQRKEPRKHRKSEIRLIESIAAQTAGAIVNARLYSELKAKAESLRAIYEISEVLAESRYYDELLSIIVSVAAELFNSKACNIMVVEEPEDRLKIMAVAGIPEKDIVGKTVPVKESTPGLAVLTRKPVQIYDAMSGGDEFHKKLALKEGIKSLLSVPLLSGGNAVGVLNVYTSYPHAFTAEEVRVIQSVASQAAATIRSKAAEERVHQLERKLSERKMIEKAKGIIMKEYRMSEEEAYAFMRKQAMDLRKTIGEVAEAIVTYKMLKKD
jgi:signal transduction protein with GAF and PtsI domain